jgi:hypothetical protein
MRIRDELSRQFRLDVAADGVVTIGERGQLSNSDSLPVFTTDTREQAHMIQVRHCRLDRDGSGRYRLNVWPQTLEQLWDVTELFRTTYEAMKCSQCTGKPLEHIDGTDRCPSCMDLEQNVSHWIKNSTTKCP